LAITRSGNTFTFWVNGVSAGTNSTSSSVATSSRNLQVAWNGNSTQFFTGYISNFRVVKGTAVYTTNFTPSTAPLTAITNTSLLTCQSATFIDNSTNNFTITVAGNSTPTTVSPFTPTATTGVAYSPSVYGGSMYFDGTGDYLSVPANAAFNYGTGNFTIEYWLYPTSHPSFVYLISQSSSTDYAPVLVGLSSGRPSLAVSSNGSTWTINTFVATALTLNTWSHVATVRSGNKWSVYVNGVENVLAASTAVTPYTSSDPLGIGSEAAGAINYPYVGYLSNVRIVKGTAVYTSNFVPPVSPLTAIQNNVLLLNGTSAGVYDMSMMNNYETVGNSSLVTNIEKYGNSSLFFDGSGDYLQTPPGIVTSLGSANFTIEFWLYLPTLPSARAQLLYWNANSSGYAAVALQVCSSNKLGLSFSESGSSWKTDDTTGVGSVLTAATWQHVALVRNGQNIQIYLNGVAQGSAYTTTASTTSLMTTYTLNQIGTYNTGFHSLNGYIDDLRITDGVARYTTTFTPTTSPLLRV
jgi:hypothetical protein